MSSNHRRSSSSGYDHEAVLHDPELETQEEEPEPEPEPESVRASTAEVPSARARGENVQVLTNVAAAATAEPAQPGTFENTNVRWNMVYTFLQYAGLSIWQGQFLSLYLADLSPDVTSIGLIEGAQGIVRLATSLLAGWLVDYLKAHRNLVLRISSFYGFALYAACAIAVIYSKNVWNWLVLLCLYSPLRSLQLSAVDTIFADSTVTGNRVAAFTARQNTAQAAQVFGKLVQILIYTVVQTDSFTTETLQYVMLAGIACQGLGCAPQLFMTQAKTRGTHAEVAESSDLSQPLQSAKKVAQRVRWFLTLHNLMLVLSSGIVSKYYGLFFVKTYNLSPIQFSLIQLVRPIAMLIFTVSAGLATRKCPRAVVCLILLVICNSAAMVMGFEEYFGFPSDWNLWVDVAAWVLLSGSSDATEGLKSTILMDNVPKRNRGKWNSMNDIQASFWSGTAAIGGWLVDQEGYRLVLQVLGYGYITAMLPWFGVMLYAKDKPPHRKRKVAVAGDATQPLLGGSSPVNVNIPSRTEVDNKVVLSGSLR